MEPCGHSHQEGTDSSPEPPGVVPSDPNVGLPAPEPQENKYPLFQAIPFDPAANNYTYIAGSFSCSLLATHPELGREWRGQAGHSLLQLSRGPEDGG